MRGYIRRKGERSWQITLDETMRGYIRRKGERSWQITLDTGTGPDGKRHRYFETIHGRKSDAQKRLNELLVNLEKGIHPLRGGSRWESTFVIGLRGMLRLTVLSVPSTATNPL